MTGYGEDGVQTRRNGVLPSGLGSPVHCRTLWRHSHCQLGRAGGGFDGLEAVEESPGQDQAPLSRGLGHRTAGRGQLLVRSAAEKSRIRFHSLCPG